MELILNLVWLILAAAIVLLFVAARRGACCAGREWLAVLCLIVLLFPVVSMSDDMMLTTAYSETGRQDLIVHLLPGNNNQLDSTVVSSASESVSCTAMAFGCRFGVFDVAPRLTIFQWSPRVEKRPPPSSYLAG